MSNFTTTKVGKLWDPLAKKDAFDRELRVGSFVYISPTGYSYAASGVVVGETGHGLRIVVCWDPKEIPDELYFENILRDCVRIDDPVLANGNAARHVQQAIQNLHGY